MKVLLLLTIALVCVFAKEQYTTTSSSSELGILNLQNYKKQVIEQVHQVEKLVQNARTELKTNNNIRPSTEYNMDDIIFILRKYLPSWVYPSSIWKQDIVTRRRNIARIVRSSPLISRPRAVMIRDKVIEWTHKSNENFANNYVIETVEGLESLIDSMLDFVKVATDEELMNPLFLTTGFITLNNAIDEFIEGNNEKFISLTEQVNDEFNYIVALSGKLRIPLESMREDAISQTKYIRDELFTKIEYGLHILGHNIQADIQRLSLEIVETDRLTSEALRKHTADSIQSGIQYFENIKLTLAKLKSVIGHVWENATNELVQSPTRVDYWIDVTAEVKEAFTELGRLLADTVRKYNKRSNSCPCGWSYKVM